MANASYTQEIRLTFKYFWDEFKEGWRILFSECYGLARRSFLSKTKGSAKDREHPIGRAEEVGEKDATRIAYGFNVMGKLYTSLGIYGLCYLLGPQPGLVCSRRFAYASYLVLALSSCFAVMLTNSVVSSSRANLLMGLRGRAISLIIKGITVTQMVVSSFGLACLVLILYWRQALHEFILYHSNIIALSKSEQRRQMVELFLIHCVLTILSKPVYVMVMLLSDHSQPAVLSHLSPAAFAAARYCITALATLASALHNISGMIIPLLTSYLIVCSASHVKNVLAKNLSRLKQKCARNAGSCNKGRANKHLESMLDARARRFIDHYSCDTLTSDWPPIGGTDGASDADGSEASDGRQSAQQTARSSANELNDGASTFIQPREEAPRIDTSGGLPDRRRWSEKSAERGPNRAEFMRATSYELNSTAEELMFVYKNLIRSLSELRCMVQVYESRFGSFHLLQICIESMIVAQAVTSFTQLKFREQFQAAKLFNETFVDSPNWVEQTANMIQPAEPNLTRLISLVVLIVFTFTLSNGLIFMRCNSHAEAMDRMRNKLFKMNIELSRATLQMIAQPFSSASTKVDSSTAQNRQWSVSFDAGPHRTRQALQLANEDGLAQKSIDSMADHCVQLGRVWTLYDELARISAKAQFQIATGTNYSKRCLLWIFGRTVSLTLLCIQIVDIYSNS